MTFVDKKINYKNVTRGIDMAQMNPFEQQQAIPGIKKILAVSSGKGGVGKSTVSTNLALALGKNFKVGLLDADIYGPSLPRMTGTMGQRPTITDKQKLVPIMRRGVKLMSMGHLVDEGAAVVWRGPMLFKAMDQFLRDVEWGDLDVLVIDLPPGTGDIQLTLAQKVPVAGAICVTTPQNVALADVKKAVDMWNRVKVPVLGLVENMAYMMNPVTNEKMELFPRGDIDGFLKTYQISLLGQIPFNPNVAKASEAGIPLVEAYSSSPEAMAFNELSNQVCQNLNLAFCSLRS
jgi:ATP-binding protein involved in chromosome partitioning